MFLCEGIRELRDSVSLRGKSVVVLEFFILTQFGDILLKLVFGTGQMNNGQNTNLE